MSGPGTGGPYYFAYCDEADAFNAVTHARWDEKILALKFTRAEGAIPSFEIKIKNPFTGLLAPLRKQWAWLSYWDGAAVVPRCKGRLVAFPDLDDLGIVTMRFIARPSDYIARRQAVCDPLKDGDGYDPIFLREEQRDDPTAILQGYSLAIDVDPVTHALSLTDILQGEDGTKLFGPGTPTPVIASSVRASNRQIPATAIAMNSNFEWSQVDSGGSIPTCRWRFQTFTGAQMISDWPKPGAQLAPGLYAQAAGCIDLLGIAEGQPTTLEGGFEDEGPRHVEGDAISAHASVTTPKIGNGFGWVVSETGHGAIIGDDYSQPNASYSASLQYVCGWDLFAYLDIGYSVNRKRYESLQFTLRADLQPMVYDATIDEETETLNIDSVDLSRPLWKPRNWTGLAGQNVKRGQVCYPNNPAEPGLLAYQICITPGVAGLVEPTFSTIVGDTTTDGTVVWACRGSQLDDPGPWAPFSLVSLGTVIAPITPIFYNYSAFRLPGARGSSVSAGMVVRDDLTGIFLYAMSDGVPGLFGWPAFSPIYGVPTFDGTITWISLGFFLPASSFQICVQAGQTSPLVSPPFSSIEGQAVADGTAVWVSLGLGGPSLEIPAGGVPGHITQRAYLASDRGQKSIRYLLSYCAAKLRARSRAIEISFRVRADQLQGATCRMSATLKDMRLPGGEATGKIISIVEMVDAREGTAVAEIKIGCTVGNAGTVVAGAITDSYYVADYIDDGYYEDIGAMETLGDVISYTRPAFNPNDDGLTLPLTYSQVVLMNLLIGSAADQRAAINAYRARTLRHDDMGALGAYGASGANDATDIATRAQQLTAAAPLTIENALIGHDVAVELWLRPINNEPYRTNYSLDVSTLKLPKTIDLGAAPL